jgi:hypothetical protein
MYRLFARVENAQYGCAILAGRTCYPPPPAANFGSAEYLQSIAFLAVEVRSNNDLL